MKKIVFAALCLLMVSCGGIEKDARKQLEESLKFKALDPKSVSISNEETMFKNDSMCVIDFIVRQTNANGGYERREMEYYYLKAYDGVYENLIPTGKRSFEDRVKEGIELADDLAMALSGGEFGRKISKEEFIVSKCRENKIK